MKKLLIITALWSIALPSIAQQPNLKEQNTSDTDAIVDAVFSSLTKKEEPTCYNFTDEVPPEKYIGFPACDNIPSALSGSVEIGAFFNTGDKDYVIAKGRSDLNHEVGKLRTNWILDIFGRKTEEVNEETGKKTYETTDQKWSTSLQSNYTLEKDGKNYIFGYVSYEDDRFNGFDYQTSVAAGWGRRWYETEEAYFDAEIGPGFRIDEIAETDEHNNKTKSAAIIRTAATYERSIWSTFEFKQTLSAEIAPKAGENTKIKSVSSITTKLIESLALKFAFTVDHNTEVESDTANTRTESSLTLVYSI